MAVLNKIRQRGLFLIIVIALALFSFVLADLFRNSDALTSKGQNIVATINGKDISRQEFMEKVELTQRQMGPTGSSIQAMNRVWDQEIRQAVMESQFEELGISVETEEMKDLLRTNLANTPDFLNEAGLFDEGKLNEYIANLKETSPAGYAQWVNYENSLASNSMQSNYYNLVRSGIGATVSEGELEHMMESELVDIKFIQIPFTSILDSTINVTASDISKYIKENPTQYKIEDSRDIAYVHFKEEASLEDEEAIKSKLTDMLADKVEYNEVIKANENVIGFKNIVAQDIEDYVNANSAIRYVDQYMFKSNLSATSADSIFKFNVGEVYGPYKEANFIKLSKVVAETNLPDSVKVRHILIPFVGATRADASVTKTDEAAKKTADSILSVIKSRRAKFVDLLELSSDKVSNEKGGEIEFAYGAGMAPEFKNFSFENKKGDIDVVKTSFGYHIIEILSQGNTERAIKVATIAEAIEPSQKTIDDTFNETSKFEIAVSKGNFEDVAKENNYALRPVNSIKQLDENIPGIGNQRAIVRWAFEDGTDVGDVKRFNFNGGYAVVQMRAKNKAGFMSTEDASVTATPAIRKEKKAQIIRDRISGKSFDDISSSENQSIKVASALNMKNPTITGAGREPMVVGAAFGLNEGETSSPIDGNNGVYLVQVTKRTPAVKLDSYQAKMSQLTTLRSNGVTSKLYNALKEAADIEDNRATIY
ncbi:MAG: peptidylprolyl isomerase [Flavobacteriaceae bacterium]|nr:peptidylprolyl isomerase [Flavobacteriaceae bacterium]